MQPILCSFAALALFGTTLLPAPAEAAPTPIVERPPFVNTIREHQLTARADGGFFVVWLEVSPDVPRPAAVLFQAFDANVLALASPVTLAEGDGISNVRVAPSGGGGFLLSWLAPGQANGPNGRLIAAAFSPEGERLWPDVEIDATAASEPFDFLSWPASVANGAGGWTLAWVRYSHTHSPQFELLARSLEPVHGQLLPRVSLSGVDQRDFYGVAMAPLGSESRIVWSERNSGDDSIRLLSRRLNAAGAPLAPTLQIGAANSGELSLAIGALQPIDDERLFALRVAHEADLSQSLRGAQLVGDLPLGPGFPIVRGAPSQLVAVGGAPLDDRQRALVTWGERSLVEGADVIRAQAFTPAGGRLSDPVDLVSVPVFGGPAAIALAGGGWLVAWRRTVHPTVDLSFAIDGEILTLPVTCTVNATTLCLSGGRFQALASYRDHLGHEGYGLAQPLGGDSGSFWFYSPDNVELMVKVVDACSLAPFENFWVYAAGLTDVAVRLTVVDTWTGASWEKTTSLGEPFPSTLDSGAFDTCGVAASFAMRSPSGAGR